EGVEPRLVEDLLQLGEALARHSFGERLQHILLRREVMIEAALRDAGTGDQVVDRGRLVAALEEQLPGDVEKLAAALLRMFDDAGHACCLRALLLDDRPPVCIMTDRRSEE